MIDKVISRYKILEKLGEGGMGEVYLAEDKELDRKVALKFLPSHYTEDPEINARFKREAKAAAALNHPNIITVYDVGEHEGQAFIAMEYIKGQSLKDLLAKQELATNKIIDLACQICEGLSEAHHTGIEHRDIKPENILVDAKGRVKIADFGLAKAKGRTRLTKVGSTLGTLDYMSPEQLRGVDVDHRSDIWSVGVALYEMITGQLPFEEEYEAAAVYSISHEEPEPLARYKAGVSEGLQRILDKALDKEVETRYQYIDDLLTDLKRERKKGTEHRATTTFRKRARIIKSSSLAIVLFGVLLVAVIIALVTKLTVVRKGDLEQRIPIAVVDFLNETGEKELDGLSSILITALEQSPRLSVLTRSRMFDILRQLDRSNVNRIDEGLGIRICQQANVQAMVMASVRKFGELYSIDLKVLDPSNNEYLLAANENGQGQESIPYLIDRLSEKTRQGLQERPTTIHTKSRPVADVTTTNLEAYHHFFKGQQFINKLRGGDAQKEFKKAIELDSTFALAYYRLAIAIWWSDSDEKFAKTPLQKAISMIDRIPEKERYLVRAENARLKAGYSAAIEILKEMERVYKGDKEMLFKLGDYYFHLRQYSAAEKYFERVLAMDPNFERALNQMVMVYQYTKRYEKMLACARRYAAVAASQEAYEWLTRAYSRLGDFEKALSKLEDAQELYPELKESIKGTVTGLYITTGRYQRAREEMKFLEKEEQKRLWVQMGWAYFNSRDYKNAEQCHRNALALQPKGDANIFTGLGWTLLQQWRYDEAEEIFQKGLELESAHPAMLNGLVMLNRWVGRNESLGLCKTI